MLDTEEFVSAQRRALGDGGRLVLGWGLGQQGRVGVGFRGEFDFIVLNFVF